LTPWERFRVSSRADRGNFIEPCGVIMFIFTSNLSIKTAGQKR
jgi:hypothetical protein